jgi:predicted enzyme related to lactoylglutathione lyase
MSFRQGFPDRHGFSEASAGGRAMGHYRHNGMVHMELHTHDLAGVRAFLWQLLGWRSWPVGGAGHDYLALDVSDRLGGGIVGCGQRPPSWLP